MGRSPNRMRLVTFHVPESYYEALKQLVREGRYPNVSEAIRAAVRDLLRKEWRARSRERPICA